MRARAPWARRLCVAAVATASIGAIVLLPTLAQAKRLPAGLMRDVRSRSARIERARVADAYTLPYGGGPVLHSNRTHLIFWQPAGSGLTFEPGYEALIETFLRNVSKASRSTSNVYGLTGQYSDHGGAAAYVSTYGGAVTVTDPLPPNGCQEPAGTGPGWTICLTDEQLQREIERVVRRYRMPTTSTDLYFLVTPNGLGDCEYSGSNSCALGGDVNGYCGYHSQTDDGLVLYAVIPFNAVQGHCQSDNPRPNGSTADPTISTISHEQSEMITDPLGDAWVDPHSGEEDGDLCVTRFGPVIGGSGPSAFNENISGGHYYLQEVWSDRNGGCEARAKPDSVSFQSGRGSTHTLSLWFLGHAYDPEGRIVAYRWYFGDGHGSFGRRAWHRYLRSGRYRVVLRASDSWGNWAFYAATVTVSRTAGGLTLQT